MRKKLILLTGLICAIVAVCGVHAKEFGEDVTSSDASSFNASISETDTGDVTEESESVFEMSSEHYELVLHFRNGEDETLTEKDIGYRFDEDGAAAKTLTSQLPVYRIGGGSDIMTPNSYILDRQKLQMAVEALPELDPDNWDAPMDAYMKLTDKHTVEIVPETDGTIIDEDRLLATVEEAVRNNVTEISTKELDDVYEKASVTASDENLRNAAEKLNGYLGAAVTFLMSDGEDRALDGSVICGWLTEDPDHDGWYMLDDGHLRECVKEYIAGLASEDDYWGTTTVFSSTNLGEVSVPVGSAWGHEIDQAAMTEAVLRDLERGASVRQDLIYSWNDPVPVSIGNTYIEVDVENQTVYYYLNGILMYKTDCVTGLETNGARRTPSGVYHVLWKMKDHLMRGSYGTAFCKYAVVFSSAGLYLHDASWRGSFGGTIYKTSGSHGCVNLPTEAAKYFYENVPIGTPVVIFRPDPVS